MAAINIDQISIDPNDNPLQFQVEVVGEDLSKTNHTVRLTKDYYVRLTGGLKSPKELIRASFEFLLGREPKESILPSFDLAEIQKHFPEYETLISSSSPELD
jgi:hypothetical protein